VVVAAFFAITTSAYLENMARRHLRLGSLPRRHVCHAFLGLHLVVESVLWSKTRMQKPFDLPCFVFACVDGGCPGEGGQVRSNWCGLVPVCPCPPTHAIHSFMCPYYTYAQIRCLPPTACTLALGDGKQRPEEACVSRLPLPLRCNSGSHHRHTQPHHLHMLTGCQSSRGTARCRPLPPLKGAPEPLFPSSLAFGRSPSFPLVQPATSLSFHP